MTEQLILGLPFLEQAKAVISFNTGQIQFSKPPDVQTIQTSEGCPIATPADNKEIKDILSDYNDIFAKTYPLPVHSKYDMCVTLNTTLKIKIGKLRTLPTIQLETVNQYIDKMLNNGYIKRRITDQASSLILVKKPDDTYRVCVDYRILNSVTQKNIYPLPLVNSLLQIIGQRRIFNKIDLRDAFYHIRVHKRAKNCLHSDAIGAHSHIE
jgi:hypothetical protein